MKRARLALEGVSPDEITAAFLVSLMELSEEYGLETLGISIDRRGGNDV